MFVVRGFRLFVVAWSWMADGLSCVSHFRCCLCLWLMAGRLHVPLLLICLTTLLWMAAYELMAPFALVFGPFLRGRSWLFFLPGPGSGCRSVVSGLVCILRDTPERLL